MWDVLNHMFLALLGGLVLNFMPCVFPILSLKMLSIVKKANTDRRRMIINVACYVCGVHGAFAVLAIFPVVLKVFGHFVGWGFHMQSPAMVAMLTYIMFMIGLNLSGVYEFRFGGVSMSGTPEKNEWLESLLSGVLIVLLSAPCTAPFMGAAVAFAFTQPLICTLLIIQSLAAGFVMPYVLVCFFPFVARFLPKPGVWMEDFKHLMAFPMYATVLWLLMVLKAEQGVAFMFTLMWALLFAFLFMQISNLSSLRSSNASRVFFWCGVALPVFVILQGLFFASPSIEKIKFDPSFVESMQRKNNPMLVVATADWCVTCKVSEKTVFSSKKFQQVMQDKGIAYVEADWTNRDDEITSYLLKYGSAGVPLYVAYDCKGGVRVLPRLLTVDKITNILSELPGCK